MSVETNIAALCREFADALTEVLAETAAVGPARRGRLARAHAAVKRHPDYNEYEFSSAVETAFAHWETLQNAPSPLPSMLARSWGTQVMRIQARNL